MGDADELRATVLAVIRKNEKLKYANVSMKERKALDSLKKDERIKILPANKGRTMVSPDTEEYIQKCNALLDQTSAFVTCWIGGGVINKDLYTRPTTPVL